MVREYIIPVDDKKNKTYKVKYMGDKLLVTSVKDKGGEYTIVPGYLKSDVYDRGWETRGARVEEIDSLERRSKIEEYLMEKGMKGPFNFWSKKDK